MGKIYVPAKSIEEARRQFEKEVNPKYWVLVRVRLARKGEYPYKRTHGYKTYVLVTRKKAKKR